MRMIGNKIECYRGESFTLQIPLVRPDGVPFYIGADVKNPYLCLTIKSNKYSMNGRYCKKYWLDMSSVKKIDAVMQLQKYAYVFPKVWYANEVQTEGHPLSFISSDRLLIMSVDSPGGITIPEFVGKNPEIYDTIPATDFPKATNSRGPELPYAVSTKERLYYLITDFGREYYYWNDTEKMYTPYSFTYKKQFLNEDTKNWPNQQCTYELSYVAGIKMIDWLTSVYKSLYGEYNTPTANKELAHWICKKAPHMLDGVDINDPIASYTINEVLLGPNKLIIKER